ncbi:MAG: cation transporter [Prolixibacteraceae bacterium]|jgi:copper chaperone CopZ
MKNIFFILVLMVAFSACQSPKQKTDSSKSEVAVAKVETTLRVEGMTCTECEQSVAKGVNALAGIDSISANHLDSTAFVRYDPSKTDLAQITKAIEDRGYEVVASAK